MRLPPCSLRADRNTDVPELPDLEDYLAAMRVRMVGATITRVRVAGISLLRTYDPPLEGLVGRRVTDLHRAGKRLVWEVRTGRGGDAASRGEPPSDGDDAEPWYVILHLMIAGRLRWAGPDADPPGRSGLAVFGFTATDDDTTPGGTLLLTEAGTKKRASLHLVRGRAALAAHDRGGIEPLEADLAAFERHLLLENRTLKRVLTDQRRFAGIGNAYSDEILHAAGLSPVRRTRNLEAEEIARLHGATQQILRTWTARLREATGDGFPAKVTAFREGFAVHGRFQQPCPVCGTAVQRIRYAENEVNYCPRCQTGGAVLADRSMSRLLKDDRPRTIEQLEDRG
ncbi:MAG: Fpg/Nei family DNA glycosylase [Intrasporangiaceae bacterium]|nr:Fpg/Nei family DNA glycosylase [Intrasporangiaceae bacterium]